jgi:hypothetical protein
MRRFIGMCLLFVVLTTPARALDPGIYTVRCPDGATNYEYKLRIDEVDLLTMKNSMGAIISGTRVDDGGDVILTNTQGCALIEDPHHTEAKSD